MTRSDPQQRHVVVTGGGTGIGLACAARLRARGDAVWVTGRRPGPLAAAADRTGATAVPFDAADPAAVAAALDHLPERVDVLVLCAGGIPAPPAADPAGGPRARLVTTAEAWRATFATNVLTTVLVTEALADRIAPHGRVVALGSIAARTGAGDYGAAKAALEAWAAGTARRLGPRGITVNVVAPGLTEGTGFFGGPIAPERRARLVDATLTGRPGTTDDVAAAVEFLASPDAGHVTGQVLPVNGGAQLAR